MNESDTASYSQFPSTRIDRVLKPEGVLMAVSLRMKHYVDERPQRNCIFEVDSDLSEDALVKVVQKLSSKFAHIDVITADEELLPLVVSRLKKELGTMTVAETKTATTMINLWTESDEETSLYDYSLTIGTLSHFVRAEFERDVKETREENHVVVLYRTESFLEGRGLLETLPVETVDMHVGSLLCHVYVLVDQLDHEELMRRLQDYIKRYPHPFVHRWLEGRLADLARSARAAKGLVEGAHFGFLRIDGKDRLIVTSSIESEHLGIRQFIQIHHSLPITPIRAATVSRSTHHILKTHDRLFGVFRRGGYEFEHWLLFMRAPLSLFPSRVYPLAHPVKPVLAMPASATISDWIVQVEQLMIPMARKISPIGTRLVVCPSTAAMNQLWRYLKYSHDIVVSLTTMMLALGPVEDLERKLFRRDCNQVVIVFTTAAHFLLWHTRYLIDMWEVTIFLGTPRSDVSCLHQAYRFARPVTRVVTVPLEMGPDHGANDDSGFESDNSSGRERQTEEQPEPANPLEDIPQVENRSNWADLFMKQYFGRLEWRTPLSTAEDEEYDKCVQWMRGKWREQLMEENSVVDFDEWRGRMMEEYRGREGGGEDTVDPPSDSH